MEKELLDKYFAGQCTPWEAARVRQWLDQPITNEDRLLKKSWLHIQNHMRADAIRLINPWTKYFAAATVAFLIIGGAALQLTSQHFVIRNTSQHYEAFDAKGLQVRLPPQASARINMGVVENDAVLMFCGDVSIHNTSENDIDMKLNLACASDGRPEQSAMITVRKDKKIVAFQYRLKSDELIVVEEDRLFDLPLPLQKKAFEALEI